MKKLLLATIILFCGSKKILAAPASLLGTPSNILGITTNTGGYTGTSTFTVVDASNVPASLKVDNLTLSGNLTSSGSQTVTGNQTVTGTQTITSSSTIYGNLTFGTSGNGIVGSVLNDNTNGANIGYQASTASANATPYGGSGVWTDLVSTSIPPGDYFISLMEESVANGATVTGVAAGISTTSGNSATGLVGGDNRTDGTGPTSAAFYGLAIPMYHINITSQTTYYMKVLSTYSAATPTVYGRLTIYRIH